MYTTYSKGDLDSEPVDITDLINQTPENEIVDKYDLENCIQWIKKNNFQTTCLQFPNSLLNDGTSIAIFLQNALGRVVYILGDTAYGSCCVDEVAAEHVNGDSIIHFGHACLSPAIKLPVFYVFEKKNLTFTNAVKSLGVLNGYIVVFYSDDYHHLYADLCNAFKDKKNVCISRLWLNHKKEISNNEEIICGRIFTRSPDAEIVPVYIGEDSVTLHNIVLSFPDIPFYWYTEEEGLKGYERDTKFLMKRNFLVEKIKDAKIIGILIATLGIQDYLEGIQRIKLLAKRKGKKCYVLAVGKPNIAKLANFPEVDVFVLISCQENSLFRDFKGYYKPIVSLMEVEVALGDHLYGLKYTLDFRELLPGGSFHTEIKPDFELPSEPNIRSQEVMGKNPGTLIAYAGAEFLAKRSWRGLEKNLGKTEVMRASKGRSGIPQAYENELETFRPDEHPKP